MSELNDVRFQANASYTLITLFKILLMLSVPDKGCSRKASGAVCWISTVLYIASLHTSTTAYAVSAYHHCCFEFESRSGREVQHYVIKFVSDFRLVGGFLRVLRFPPPIKLTATI